MNNLEQQARELLAAEYERDGYIQTANQLRAGYVQTKIDGRALRAIIAALTQQNNQNEIDKLDSMLDEVMKQRDHAYAIIDKLCDAVLGTDRNEWSSAYFFEDAVEEVEDRMYALTSAQGNTAGEGEAVRKALDYLHPFLDQHPLAAPDWAIQLASILTGGDGCGWAGK